MKLGTKSVLFGAHAFWLHPWFVAFAWWRLYGFPWDPRLWVAFMVHDLGYFGKPNMDGPEGEAHPIWAGRVMTWLFDDFIPMEGDRNCGGQPIAGWIEISDPHTGDAFFLGPWGRFVAFHSRYLAKAHGEPYTRLCVADKLAISLTPAWLYLPLVRLSGEVREYMRDAGTKHADMPISVTTDRRWYQGVQDYCRRWALEHADGREDHWTSARREPQGPDGVWK